MKEHKYKIRYDLKIETREENYTKNDVNGMGLTDALILISIILPEDGSYSQAIVRGRNGKEKRALTPDEIFKAWIILGLNLHKAEELTGWKKEYVKLHHMSITSMLSRNHDGN